MSNTADCKVADGVCERHTANNPSCVMHTVEKAQFLRFEFGRSRIDWEDDGNVTDYGWWVMLYVRGKHRARWASTRGTTRMWPRITRGGDENCNRAVTLVLWPLGHLDVWWETRWRPEGSGLCDRCEAEMSEMDLPPARGAS